MDLEAGQSTDYEYLDSGAGARLERFGPYIFARPSPVAIWPREKPELWAKAAGVYQRSSSGGGQWEFSQKLPATWLMQWDGLTFQIRPTGFGHMGFFPEHTCHWPWIRQRIQSAPGQCRVLHLFAYTGAMTLLAARAGAEVCHVDAVPDVNDWARKNAEASQLDEAPIRWIAEDAVKFVARESRRQRQYDAVVLDPPSYGRGPKGEKWILEEHLAGLLSALPQLMSPHPRFLLFTCHNPGFSPPLMRNMLIPWGEEFGGSIEEGTMIVRSPGLRCVLPSGFYARWSAEK